MPRLKITVPDDSEGYQYNGHCYEPGDCFFVPKCMAHCFNETNLPTPLAACWPDRCPGPNGWSTDDTYQNVYFLPAGVEVIAPIPTIPGCGAPATAEIVSCGGGCLFVDFDTPVALPDAAVEGGIAPTMNPLGELNICGCGYENIHMIAGVDSYVQIYYWGNCCE